MAEIDTNPALPVWPLPPVRKIDPEDKGSQKRPRQQRDDDKKKKDDGDDDSSPHIDEYA